MVENGEWKALVKDSSEGFQHLNGVFSTCCDRYLLVCDRYPLLVLTLHIVYREKMILHCRAWLS